MSTNVNTFLRPFIGPAGRSAFVGSVSTTTIATGVLCGGFAVSWLLPYHTFPFWAFYNDYLSVISVVLALFIFYSKNRVRAEIPSPSYVPCALAVIVGIDALTGRMPAPWDAFIPIGYLVCAASAIVLAVNIARCEAGDVALRRSYRYLSFAIVLAGICSALITYFQYFRVDDLLGDWSVGMGNGSDALRPFGNLGQPNQLALILCWSLAGLWWLFQIGDLGGKVTIFLSTLLLASLALTQSKIAWLIIPLLGAIVVLSNRRPDIRKASPLVVILLIAVFCGFVWELPALTQLSGTPTEAIGKRLETNGVRSVMILEGFYIGLQHPWLGVGWSSYGRNQVLVAPLFGETQYAMHSHNIVANFAAELGIPITILLIAVTFIWFYRRYIAVRCSPRAVFALMVFVAVGVHSMVEFPLWYAYVLLPVAFLTGLVEAEVKNAPRLSLNRNAVVVTCIVGSFVMVVVSHDYRDVVQGFRALGYQRLGWNYYGGSTKAPPFTVFPLYYRYFEFANVHPTVGMPAEDIARYEAVKERFGYAPVLMRMATIYALNGRQADAVTTMMALRRLYAQRYAEAYASWQTMGKEYPEVLGAVYGRLPPP